MNIDLNIAATISAVFWPTIVLVIVFVYRSEIPALVRVLLSRVKKLEFAGISFELSLAKPFAPEFSDFPTASEIEINSSLPSALLTQLTDESSGDYTLINLGKGESWLTSRLFILSIFAQMKGIRCFVFVETSGATRRRFIGWADPARVRWALARKYPWLERAYAGAYNSIADNSVIVSRNGSLGYSYNPVNLGAGIDLLSRYLENIRLPRLPPPMPTEAGEWVDITSNPNKREHAHWVKTEELKMVLGEDFSITYANFRVLRSKTPEEQTKLILSIPSPFVAVVDDDLQFEYLVLRDVLVEQVVKKFVAEPNERE
jgi:hypothetical protein